MTFKELRLSKGLSLAEMGEILGKSRSTINMYETGKVRIPEEVYAKIEAHFHVNLKEDVDLEDAALEDAVLEDAAPEVEDEMPAQTEAVKKQKEEGKEGLDSETLKEIRLSFKMTQKQIAEIIGKSISTVTGYEKGTAKIPAAVAETLEKWVAAQKKTEEKADVFAASEEAKPEIKKEKQETGEVPVIIQSMMGGSIRVEDVINKVREVAPRADAIYIKPEENRAYWTAGKKAGHVVLW